MKVKDVLFRDPTTHPLINQGQARISDARDDRALLELRGELSSFVCEGQFAEGIRRIVQSFIDNSSKTSQRGAWVSGFFGSGKSHLLKMLCHLWNNTVFPDGATSRSLVPTIPDDLNDLLRELDTTGRRAGGLLAAAGSLPSGSSEAVRLTILGILLNACGLPRQYPQARFCLWLHNQGMFDAVRSAVEDADKPFLRELNNLYVSGPIARALMVADAGFAGTEADAKQLLKAQFPPQTSDISSEDFLHTAKESLRLVGRNGRLPCTVLILDEVQQYIGDSNDRSVLVTEVAEAVSKQLDSQVMIIGAGQSALTDVPLLQKLMDRFTIRVPLSDADVETVTRKVLLQKTATGLPKVQTLIETHAGEIARHLQGTRIGGTPDDRTVIDQDYPLLPVRRRFWEHCFRQIDAAGTSSQLRSQLRIIYDAVAKLADRPLGALVPADDLYEALAPDMVNTGVLLREINERIIQVGRTEGTLAQRICGLVFLIGKLKRQGDIDIGVRATDDHLADLLIDDLSAENGRLRADIDAVLKKLSDQGLLMLVDNEYRLQTREGSEWDREFRNRQTRLNNDDGAIQLQRDQLVYGELNRIIGKLKVIHGAAKVSRDYDIHREQSPPKLDAASRRALTRQEGASTPRVDAPSWRVTTDSSKVPIWIRDGWSCSDSDLRATARAAGTDSPLIFVFVPRQSADDIRRLIVDTEAAQQTLNDKGNPTTNGGREARQAMQNRHDRAVADRDRLIREVVANAKVFQGGGSELLQSSLEDRLRAATEAALIRLFPRFREADSNAWDVAIKRAREGHDHPLQPTGYTDATEKHPVCQVVLSTVGAGKSGTEIRKALAASPFGWPRDAVDAVLLALTRAQWLTATLNHTPVPLGQLDQAKIPKTTFKVEQATLSVGDKLILRSLFQGLGVTCRSGEEGGKAIAFLQSLKTLAQSAGGDPPLPPAPVDAASSRVHTRQDGASPILQEIDDIQSLTGNAQLVAIRDRALEWKEKIPDWSATRDLAQSRMPVWTLVERLARHAEGHEAARPLLDEVAAIREQRLLLAAADPAAAVRASLCNFLRDAVLDHQSRYRSAYDQALADLTASDVWHRLSAEDQTQILAQVGLLPAAAADVATDDSLARTLDAKPLTTAQAEIDAIPGRKARALELAATKLEPRVVTVSIERTTLQSEADIEAWTERQKAKLLSALRQGPVLVQ